MDQHMNAATIGRYLAVPLQMAPLMLIAVFSLLTVVAFYAGLFGIPLVLLLFTGFFKYAFILLDGIVEGAREPPVLSIEMMNPVHGQRSLMFLVMVIALFFVSGAAPYFLGWAFASVLGVVALGMLPAVVAVHGATASLAQALDPRRCLRLMLRLGNDYVLVLLCIGGLWLIVQAIERTMGDALPLIVRVALAMYVWLATFAVVGGVMFERRLDIGLDDASMIEAEEIAEDLEKPRNKVLDRIYAEWRGGAHSNAWQTIVEHLEQSADRMAELEWLYERTAAWPDPRLASRLAQELLPKLLAARRTGEALRITRERLACDAEFRPLAATDLLRLAELARDGGDRPTARRLLGTFSRFYPQDPLQSAADRLMQLLER